MVARQRQREEEAEARRASRKAAGPAAEQPPARPAAEPTEPPRTAPRLNLAPRSGTGAGPSWRERQAAKEAAEASAPPKAAPPKEEPQPTQPARKPGGYVPPHLRAGGAARAEAPPNGLSEHGRFSRPSREPRDSSNPPPRVSSSRWKQ